MTQTTVRERVLLADVRASVLSVDEVLALVQDPACGAVCTFVGVVRDHDRGRGVDALAYSAHPLATDRLREICEEVTTRHTGARVAAVHRVADLTIGDLAVVVAVAAPHRSEAFEACRETIEALKHEVPIWKHQVFTDGQDEWVGIA